MIRLQIEHAGGLFGVYRGPFVDVPEYQPGYIDVRLVGDDIVDLLVDGLAQVEDGREGPRPVGEHEVGGFVVRQLGFGLEEPSFDSVVHR